LLKSSRLARFLFSEKQYLLRNIFRLSRFSAIEYLHFPELMVCDRH
jgi:hypothetical protein